MIEAASSPEWVARSLTGTAEIRVSVWTYGGGKQTPRAHGHPHCEEGRCGPGRTISAHALLKRRGPYGVRFK